MKFSFQQHRFRYNWILLYIYIYIYIFDPTNELIKKAIASASVRRPVLLRCVLLLAERHVHRNVVIGARVRGSGNVQEDEAKDVVLLVLFMVLGSLGDTYPSLDDYGSRPDSTSDLREAKLPRQRRLLVQM